MPCRRHFYDEIKAEVEKYFQSRGSNRLGIARRVHEVEEFYKSFKPVTKKENAWLITWQDLQDDKPVKETIISIRSSRTGEETITDFVEQYFIATCFPLAAKMTFATVSSKILQYDPYPKTYPFSRLRWKIHCGYNPRIYARIVRNLTVKMNGGKEEVSWDEIDDFIVSQP